MDLTFYAAMARRANRTHTLRSWSKQEESHVWLSHLCHVQTQLSKCHWNCEWCSLVRATELWRKGKCWLKHVPWQLGTSGFISGYWDREVGKGLEGQKQKWCYEQQRKTCYCYGQSSLFLHMLWLLSRCCPLPGALRTKRFVCLAVVRVCSTSNCWRVLVIKLFVSKQKACYALIHRILNLVWSQRNNLLCGTEWPVQL